MTTTPLNRAIRCEPRNINIVLTRVEWNEIVTIINRAELAERLRLAGSHEDMGRIGEILSKGIQETRP